MCFTINYNTASTISFEDKFEGKGNEKINIRTMLSKYFTATDIKVNKLLSL